MARVLRFREDKKKTFWIALTIHGVAYFTRVTSVGTGPCGAEVAPEETAGSRGELPGLLALLLSPPSPATIAAGVPVVSWQLPLGADVFAVPCMCWWWWVIAVALLAAWLDECGWVPVLLIGVTACLPDRDKVVGIVWGEGRELWRVSPVEVAPRGEEQFDWLSKSSDIITSWARRRHCNKNQTFKQLNVSFYNQE